MSENIWYLSVTVFSHFYGSTLMTILSQKKYINGNAKPVKSVSNPLFVYLIISRKLAMGVFEVN